MDIEIATGTDSLISIDRPNSKAHIVACAILNEKADLTLIQNQIKTRFFNFLAFRKLQKILKTFCFVYYWVPITTFSLENHIEIMNKPIETPAELNEFMTYHTSECSFPPNQPKWKFYLIPCLFSKKTAIILKIHHSYGDGVSVMSFILNLGSSKPFQMINLPKISTLNWVVLLPFGLIQALRLLFVLMTSGLDGKNCNSFKICDSKGKKNGFCSQAFSIEALKTYCKTQGVHFNELILAIYNQALQNLHQKTFKNDIKKLPLLVTASLRGLPQPGRPLKLANYTNFIRDIEFPQGSFQEILLKYQKIVSGFKKCYDFYFYHFFIEVIFAAFPSFLAFWIMNRFFQIYPFIFTSMPGPQTSVSLFNYIVEDFLFMANSPGNINVIFNVLSYNGKVIFGCFADSSTKMDARQLVAEIERVIDSELKKAI